MKSANLIEISSNAGFQQAINQINWNFKALRSELTSADQTSNISITQDLTQQIADAEEAIGNYVEGSLTQLNEKIAEGQREIDNKLEELRKLIDEAAKDPLSSVPAIGTFIWSKQDPNELWPGTKWVRHDEGLYLISSGKELADDSSVGANEVTLTEDQLPSHTHTTSDHTHDIAHTHTMAHTHKGPSHTHTFTGTAASHDHSRTGDFPYIAIMSSQVTASGIGEMKSVAATSTSTNYCPYTKADVNWTYGASVGSTSITPKGTISNSGDGDTGAASNSTTSAASTSTSGKAGSGNTGATGGGKPFDNRPKSIAAPLWERVG